MSRYMGADTQYMWGQARSGQPAGRIFQKKGLPAAAESRPPPTAALFFEKSGQPAGRVGNSDG